MVFFISSSSIVKKKILKEGKSVHRITGSHINNIDHQYEGRYFFIFTFCDLIFFLYINF